ncbi:MAG: FKBP-type peptidyl-prolyl cis-trans isomerase [Akkermansia sp.]
MPVGSKWIVYIPSELAYGENTPGAPIEPNSPLIFDLELDGISEAPAPRAAP